MAEDLDRCLAALRHRIDGEVLVPGEAGFAAACGGWNRGVDARTPGGRRRRRRGRRHRRRDVRRRGRARARRAGHRPRPGGGGGRRAARDQPHGRARGRRRDPHGLGRRRVLVGAGRRRRAEHGLAPPAGSSSAVGAVGSTLGGGLGWLARRYGPACDAVRSFEVVTPAGELVQASRDEHPALFRALRGGGGGTPRRRDGDGDRAVPGVTVYAGNMRYPPRRPPTWSPRGRHGSTGHATS